MLSEVWSTSIITTNKKLSVKRAVVGTMLLNPIGGAVGAVTRKKCITSAKSVAINGNYNF